MRQFQEDELRYLRNLRYELAANSVVLHVIKLRILVGKANFNPNQPRVPRGNPDSGQWTDGSADGFDYSLLLVTHDPGGPDQPPDIPEQKPPTIRQRNRISVAVARYFRNVNIGFRAAEITVWVVDHAGDRIVAFLDEPKPLEELQRAVTDPKFGYDIHHIVEQGPARQDRFPDSMIDASENLVRIPTYRHWEINSWFQTRNELYGNLSPREYLRERSWAERRRVGLKALVELGVLKP